MAKTDDPTYQVWKRCRHRCSEKFHQRQNYFDRGIRFNFDSFEEFKEYVEALENFREPGYSIDRIDNDKGYEPGNIKYSTKVEQQFNTSNRVNNRTGHKGIKVNEWGSYRATFNYNKKKLFDKTFKTLEEAIYERQLFVDDFIKSI